MYSAIASIAFAFNDLQIYSVYIPVVFPCKSMSYKRAGEKLKQQTCTEQPMLHTIMNLSTVKKTKATQQPEKLKKATVIFLREISLYSYSIY